MTLLIRGVDSTFKFSVSDLVYFDDCRRQWRWNREYTTTKPAYQLWFGNVLHAGLEGYYRGNRQLQAGLVAMGNQLTETIDEMRDQDPATFLQTIDKYEEMAGMFDPILTNYSLFDQANPLPGVVYDVEKYFNLPLSRNYSLSGKIDLVMKTDQGLIVVDHKTTGSMPTNLVGLDMDEQLTAYSWACWKLYGKLPVAVIYNNILKSVPKEPEVLKTLTKDKKPQLSKALGQSTVYDVYVAKLREIEAEVSDYQEILAYLKAKGWSSYFRREEASRNLTSVKRFQARAVEKMTLMELSCNNFDAAYPSPQTYRCQFCAFLQPCKMVESGEDAQYTLDSGYVKWDDIHARRDAKKISHPLISF